MCRMKQHFVLLLIPRTRMPQFRLRRRPRLLYTLYFEGLCFRNRLRPHSLRWIGSYILWTQTQNVQTNHQLQLLNFRGYPYCGYRPAWLLESFIPLYSSCKFGLSFGFLRLGETGAFGLDVSVGSDERELDYSKVDDSASSGAYVYAL